MKKSLLCLSVLLLVGVAAAELPIPQTSFRKASLSTLQKYVSDGNAEAQLELALRTYAGHQVQKNPAGALQLMQLAAQQQHPEALYLLSRMYAEGIGTKPDPEAEELWFAKAIAASPDNQTLLSLYGAYMNDSSRAQRVLKKCADAGYRPAVLRFRFPEAVRFYQNEQYEDALLRFLELAERGSVESAYYAGRIYADGRGNLEADPVEAFVFFKQAAEGGYARAQYELALCYEKGSGVQTDSAQAALWHRKAAENGHMKAWLRRMMLLTPNGTSIKTH
jgi:TPR repeat protein